jgi:hypothetical protein
MQRRTPKGGLRGRSVPPSFIVAPSSVSDQAGVGVYAGRRFNVRSELGLVYPGTVASQTIYKELNDLLVAMTLNPSMEEQLSALKKLKRKFNVEITKELDTHDDIPPNWDAIYDTFIEYQYGLSTGNLIYFPYYWWKSGKVWIKENDPEYFPLLFNEPPPYNTFYNIVKKAMQSSRPNVRAMEKKGEIYYSVISQINPGDEILICYGPLYKRGKSGYDYPINLSSEGGCGDPSIVLPGIPTTEDEKELVENYNKQVKEFKFLAQQFRRADPTLALQSEERVEQEQAEEKAEEEVEEQEESRCGRRKNKREKRDREATPTTVNSTPTLGRSDEEETSERQKRAALEDAPLRILSLKKELENHTLDVIQDKIIIEKFQRMRRDLQQILYISNRVQRLQDDLSKIIPLASKDHVKTYKRCIQVVRSVPIINQELIEELNRCLDVIKGALTPL